jgi:CopG-like RHH_1 or ribbon-helix-helix domain, RHH_5
MVTCLHFRRRFAPPRRPPTTLFDRRSIQERKTQMTTGTRPRKEEMMHIRFPLELKNEIERVAAEQDRTWSGMVRTLCREGLERHAD